MKKELELLDRKIKKIRVRKIPHTFLSIINKDFDEVTITKCLSFLLNPEYTSLKIVENILNLTQNDLDEKDFVELYNNEYSTFESIESEISVSAHSRIDILIKFSNFWIVIENKINSYENNEQSLKYEKDLKKETTLPIKYICLKPLYNKCKMKNEKFSVISYNDIAEILKNLSKYDLSDMENYIFIDDFIKHLEVFLMNENEIEISEDIEFYIDNKDIIQNIILNYKKQCEIVKNLLESELDDMFKEKYDTHSSLKYGYYQVWKKEWNNENYNGIHFELIVDFNNIIGYEKEIKFVIHNEIKTKKKYPNIKSQTLYKNTYNFDTSKNINFSIEQIKKDFYKVVTNNVELINNLIINN